MSSSGLFPSDIINIKYIIVENGPLNSDSENCNSSITIFSQKNQNKMIAKAKFLRIQSNILINHEFINKALLGNSWIQIY